MACVLCGCRVVAVSPFCPACGQPAAMAFGPWLAAPVSVAAAMPAKRYEGVAIAGWILGMIAGFAWMVPFIGFPVCITGIALSAVGLNGTQRGKAMFGLVAGIIFLVFTIFCFMFFSLF